MKVKLNSKFQRDEAERALHAIGAFESSYTDAELKLGATVLVLPDALALDFKRALVELLRDVKSQHDRGRSNAVHSVLRNTMKAFGATPGFIAVPPAMAVANDWHNEPRND